jgi:hypothetical protein
MSVAQLRPLSFGEILDGAFTLYRRHFATFALTALLAYTPVIVIYLAQGLVGGSSTERLVASGIATLLLFPAYIVALGLGRPALVRLASNAYLGQPVSRADAFAVGRRRFWTLLLTALLAGIATGIGFVFFIVPGILLGLMFFATDQVVTLEGTWGADALSRSATLAKGAWGRVFGIWVVLYLIVYMPMAALGIGAVMLLPSFVSGVTPDQMSGGFAVFQVSIVVLSALVQPLIVIGMTLQYYDRRIRTEALDLAAPPETSAGTLALG